nr:MAG TPA: hypothetical protein [Caudoviricetes sp.]
MIGEELRYAPLLFLVMCQCVVRVCQKVIKRCWCVVSEKSPKEYLVIFVR